MGTLYLWVLLIAAAVLAIPQCADAQSRVALVVGNGTYQKVPALPNPLHDAQDVSDALKRLGFTVNTVTDADFDTFRRSLLEFGRRAQKADMAVFYYAGHGVEINGDNWLLPIDVALKHEIDASAEAIDLRSAMQAVSSAKTLGLVILDACRNNPFRPSMGNSSSTRRIETLGLAPVEPSDNVLVAYAARDGTVAKDGAGRNSPYTQSLLRHIETAGLEIDFLFRNVRDDVVAATDNEQQPFVYGSLSSDEIYLKPPSAGIAAADPTGSMDADEIAWSFLKGTSDASTLTRFIDRFPASSRIPDARMRIASLEIAPSDVISDASKNVAVAFTNTEFEQAEKSVARRFLSNTPAIEAAWDVIKESKDHRIIRRFVEQFPTSNRRTTADKRLVDLGQRPIIRVPTPYRPLNVDVSILDQAAVDPDVIECFRYNDQTAMACQRAVERFPDIVRFVEDIRFKLRFCQWIGAATSCVPALNAVWNFPTTLQMKTSPAVKIPTTVGEIRKEDAKVAVTKSGGTSKDGNGQSENKDRKGQSGNKDRKAGNGSTDSHKTDHAHVHSQAQSGAVKSSQTTGSGGANGKVATTKFSPNAAPTTKAREVRVNAGGPGGGHHGR
jgi:uncharacterized caspase-like protein